MLFSIFYLLVPYGNSIAHLPIQYLYEVVNCCPMYGPFSASIDSVFSLSWLSASIGLTHWCDYVREVTVIGSISSFCESQDFLPAF